MIRCLLAFRKKNDDGCEALLSTLGLTIRPTCSLASQIASDRSCDVSRSGSPALNLPPTPRISEAPAVSFNMATRLIPRVNSHVIIFIVMVVSQRSAQINHSFAIALGNLFYIVQPSGAMSVAGARTRVAASSGKNVKVLATFTEIESGKKNDRPKLMEAMERCRLTGATVADRQARPPES